MNQTGTPGLQKPPQPPGLAFSSALALALMTAAGAVHYAFGRPTGSGVGAPNSEEVHADATSYEAYIVMNAITLALSVGIVIVDLTIIIIRDIRIIRYLTYFRNLILYIALIMGLGACLMLSYNINSGNSEKNPSVKQ